MKKKTEQNTHKKVVEAAANKLFSLDHLAVKTSLVHLHWSAKYFRTITLKYQWNEN